jgi:hypothetical protein
MGQKAGFSLLVSSYFLGQPLWRFFCLDLGQWADLDSTSFFLFKDSEFVADEKGAEMVWHWYPAKKPRQGKQIKNAWNYVELYIFYM